MANSVVWLELLDSNNNVYSPFGGSSGRVKLLVDHISFSLSRNPIVVSFPTGRQTSGPVPHNRPVAWALDLGMMQEMILLNGVAKDNDEDPEVPGHHELQEMFRYHWATVTTGGGGPNGLLKMRGGARLIVDHGPGAGGERSYQGLILNLQSTRAGGQLRWEWKMTFQVAYWPLDMRS